MKRKKRIYSLFLVAALVLTSIFQTPAGVSAKGNAKKTKYYTISKKAGTYLSAIKVKVKVKKGYRVYYKTSGKFKKTKVIKSGKSRTFKMKKTTVLSLCAVKNNRKVTDRKLNKVFRQKKTAYFAKYKYKISKVANQATPASTADSSAVESASATPGGNAASTAEPSDSSATDAPIAAVSATPVPDTQNIEGDAVAYGKEGTVKTLTINKAGTYVLSGGSASNPITNTEIIVAGNISEEVQLIWDNLVIDNSALGTNEGEDVPVFYVKKSTPDVHVTLKGSSELKGNGAYTSSPASAIICAEDAGTTLTFSAYGGDSTASLKVVDAMDSDTDFGNNDPSDGIYCKGTLAFDGGTYSITVNGDCLKGTGKDGQGGILINHGSYTLHSASGNALKSKSGNIVIHGGTIESEYTAEDGINAKNYSVIIMGGKIEIDHCYGDGIQGENVNISGDDTEIDIETYFENAGTNYYSSSLGSGNYNTLTGTDTSKTEVVNVDTGSHKGIKGGTKACTYSYQSVGEGSEYVAGTAYTTEASGGIVISGGTIKIDTTNAGIKYNGSGGGTGPGNSGGAGPGGSGGTGPGSGGGTGPGNRRGSGSSSSGNLSAANSDGQYIIGSPDDGIHSNNTCVIAGGTLEISSSDDGITGPAGIFIMDGCDITIDKCYEGIEGGEIIIGTSEGGSVSPSIKIYSDDDGVNAASKSKITYVYEDESEEKIMMG